MILLNILYRWPILQQFSVAPIDIIYKNVELNCYNDMIA